MSDTHDTPRHAAESHDVATLVRLVPVRVVDISHGGCRLESCQRIPVGASGQLAVGLQGLTRVDDVRIARCQQRQGAGSSFSVGAELLRTRRLSRRTIRMAVKALVAAGGPDIVSVGVEAVMRDEPTDSGPDPSPA